MDAEFLRCPTCEAVVLVEVPQYSGRCPEGHLPEECPERACTECGTALLSPASPTVRSRRRFAA